MTLNSPGVEVQVIDESFYVPNGPSTTPLIVVASASNKPNGSKTGIAPGTLDANAGKLWLITSQRDLVSTFGTPLFYQDPDSNPIHGGELNEYGLQAAYSFLGIANSAYVIRADIDLTQLVAQYEEPGAYPNSGTYWLDTANTRLGIFQWDGDRSTVPGGQKFTNQIPMIITDPTMLDYSNAELTYSPPLGSIGSAGEYALVSVTNINRLFFKNRAGTWVEVGSNDWAASWPTIKGSKVNPSVVSGSSMIINGVEVQANSTLLTDLADRITNAGIRGVSAAVVDYQLEIYGNGAVDSPQLDSTQSNAIVIAAGTGNLVSLSQSDSSVGIAIGTYYGPYMQISPHTTVPRFKSSDPAPRPTGSVWIKTTDVNLGARWRVKVWNSNTEAWDPVAAPLYSSVEDATFELDGVGGGKNLATGTVFVQYDFDESYDIGTMPRVADFKIWRRTVPSPTQIVSVPITASTFINGTQYKFLLAETQAGVPGLQAFKTIEFTAHGAPQDSQFFANAINSAGSVIVNGQSQGAFKYIVATVDSYNRVVITHKIGGDMRLREGLNTPLLHIGFTPWNNSTALGTANLYQDPNDPIVGTPIPGIIPTEYYPTNWFIATNWKPLIYTASDMAPQNLPANGRLWYNSILDQVDIMIHNGLKWVGYLDHTSPYYNIDPDFQTDPNGPIIMSTKPTTQSDGSTLRNGDIWIDTSDLEHYPSMYRWDGFNLVWTPVDNTDQTTELGIVFADARYNTSGANSNLPGAITDLLTSNFVDFDAPDPLLYPRGIMLFNTRRSGFNVKKFSLNHINPNTDNIRFYGESMDTYYPHRWVNASGNAENGAGLFGRKAQRKVVVKALKSMIDTNQPIRDWERNTFTLIACPGYCETIANMRVLNLDRREHSFIIGDSPFRLTSDATSLFNWGSNVNLALDNGDDGLITYYEYLAVYYPSGYTTDNLGNNIVVPPSHMVLKTIALSDAVSYPWFAPAGIRRGGVTNATAIGYINSQTGEFQSIALNEGQRDALYNVSVNPITFLTSAGITIFGQKTRYAAASSLDRVNVARLVVYLRGRLDILCKPYIFEPNDKITRDEIKASADSLMLELVGQRAIYDFLVVCDETNNTPTRIDRNELWLDIAIEPVKAIEFIYIPLRLKNTGSIAGLLTA